MDLFLIITSIIALIPIIFIKKYIVSHNIINLYIAGFFYLLLLLSYVKIFSHSEVSTSYSILQIIQILLIVIIGIFIYKESITTNKIIGIVSGIICLYYLNK
jgi:multidrug transporter EmrE-like cation transporter